ncbi:hypothetical protein HDU77_003781 [Chytriomyces hyalinus]|nr:hypothetical protein HDU77_003781 [Chytriomyces hyalinus]
MILGRRDGQIKLNGQRMEIQEITEAINLHPQVLMNAVMVVKENEEARPALAGFFVPKGIQAGSHDFGMATTEMAGYDVVSLISEIKDFLAISLPVYMIPTKWIPVTRLPTTANGKTDNKALIKLLSECGDEMTRQMNDNSSQSREPPSTEAEIALCAVWKDLLGDQDIWKSSSFYMLGGDSIAAIMLLMRCREMGFTLSISDILRCPVLEKMAERITSNNKVAQEEQQFSLLPFRLRDIPTLTQVFRSFDIDFDAVEDAYPALVIQNMLLSATFAKKDRHFDQVRLDISGIIDEADLRAAVLSAIGNSAVLRTTFIEHEGLDGYIQVVLKNPAVVWSKINLEREEDLDIFLSFDRRKSPKLGGPFFRFNLLKISPLKHVLIWSVHPCLVDDQSISNFFQDVSNVLSSAELVVRPPLNALVAHELAASKSGLNNKFWKEYLKDATPTPFPAAAGAGLALTSETIQIEQILKTSGFTDTTGVFLSTVIKAAWCLTLSSEIDSQDVIFGMMTSGREVSIQDIQNLNGPAAKPLPLRVAVPQTEKSILDFLLSIQDSVAEVLANGSVSGNQSETKESPLFQTVVNYQSMQKPAPLYAGFHHVDAPKMTRAALTLDVKQQQNGLNFSSSFDGSIITEDEVHRLLEKAFAVTDFIFNNVTRPLRTLDPILHKGEALQINELVSTKYYMDQIDNGFLHQLVEQQTARSPANLAIDSLDESIQLTYAQLNGEANRLAWFLRKSGVKAGVKVPICYEKCKDMVVSILAVLKAGGSYVALNYSNPIARNLYIIEATEAIVVLMSDAKRIEFAEHISDSVKLLTVSQIQAELALESVENLDTGSLERHDLAYTIFTSGSTGVPKGVLIDHHAVVNSIVGYSKFLTYESTSRVLQFSNLAFDVSVADIFNALSSGAALVVASQDRLLTDLQNVLIQGNVTHAFLTPTVAKMLNPWSLPNLQELTMGGEVLSQKVVDNWLEAGHCRLGNGYGPSEVTIFCSVRKITKEERTANNIGLPFGSTKAYILDDQLRFVPNGTVGELCFSGPQLSAGYFNNPEQTAKSFTYSDDIPGVRIYRSGDFARLLPNGEIEILGRMDGQIKLNGLRIEILEIVESIEAQHGVSSCAVLLAKDKDASRQRLLAFFVPAAIDFTTSEFGLVSASAVNHMSSLVNEVKANVGRILPQYMIPSHWVPVTSIPTNANGKTDSKLLLELVCESNARFLEQVNAEVEENDTASPPATEAEIALSKVWMNVLQVSSVSKSSSFFALGGDSLLAPKLESMALRLVPIETSVSVYEPLSLLPESLREQNALQRAFEQWNIDPDNVEDVYPSADLQTGMLADTFSRYTQHFDQITLDLWGLKDTKQFKKAIFSAVANNTSLKTTFIMDESYVGFLQVVLKEACIVWNEYTLSNDNEVQMYQELEKKKSVELGGSLMQFTLLTLGHERHVLIWSSHHSLLDGMSIQNIYKDIVDSYLDRKLVNRPPYRLYVEYEMQAKTSDSTKFFWSQYLKNASFTPFPHNLPQSAKPSAYKYKTLSKKFLSLGITEKTGVLLSTLFKAAWAFVLSVHSAKKDILFGMISAGREAAIANITDMVGLCIRSLPLRIIVPTDATILEYLVMVQDTISNIISHNTSLQEQQKLNKQFDQVRMFHTLANFRGFSEEMIEDAELPFMMVDREDFDEVSAAIAMEADVKPDGLQLSAFFDHHHVSESETELLLERMHYVMEFMANNMDKPIQELSAMPASEVATLTAGVMGSPYENESRHLGLHELFEKQVQRVPENVAVQFENQDFVTYDELNNRANRLARYLREHGAGPEVMIPFCLDRSVHMITSILAILKSGAGVVPLDPLNPTDRNKFVIEDVSATMVITEKKYASLYESETVQMILIDDDEDWVQLSGADVDNIAVSSNICYVLYTSGSTGKPKGVVLEHGAVSDAIIANLLVQHVTEASRVLQFSSCTFDAFIGQALATGATLCMANKQTLINDLAGTIRMMQTSFAFFTPSTAKLLTPAEVPSMKEIVLGGEPVSKSLIQTWLHHVRLSIVCGPTEAMIAVVAREVADDIVTGANLGKPFGSTKAFVLDEDLNILPVGVIGELCISSDQLAREYFHLPEKTNSTFVDNPFMPGQKMMRTGDLVKFTPELDVVIFGRKDTQIKLNGQRIEISEIEENIAAEPNVAQVLVDLVEINKTKVLTAFILPSFETEKSQDGITANQNDEIRVLVESVRSRLNKNLAPYMIPRIMVPLHKLPLTSHGKADKKLLQSVLANASSIEEYLGVTIKTKTAPEGSREKLLQGIWSGLFNIPSDKIYREDSFFALGGDSILAILLVKGCQKGGFKLAVHQIFEHPRLEDLASRLTTNELIVGRTYKNWSLLDPTVLASLPAIFDSLNMSLETVDDAYPATAMQQGLVAASQQDSSLYVAQFGYLLEGIVDAELFRQSWANVVGKTPILRTTFALSEVDGSIIQMVMSPDQFNWSDDSESTSSDQNAELDRLNGFQFGEVFSKFRMIRINSGQFKFIWTVHHALYDGWCHKQIFNDVLAAYNGDIAPERLPFSHYVEYTLNQSVQQTEEFWKMYLKDFTKTSYPKRILGGELKVKSVSDSVAFDFDLSEMLSRYGIGVSAVLKAAWGVVLSRHSNVQDVVFGLVNSGRDIALSHGADVVGPLLATVPVRFIGDSDADTLSTLVKLQQDHVNQVEHTYFGLRRITATVQDENQNTPLFSTLMNILNFADEDFTDSSFKISELDGELDVDFPLVARFYPSKSGVNIDLSYNTGYVTDSDAKLLVRHVQTAIQQIVLNPSMPLSTVDMMGEEERNLILKSSSASPTSESSSKCLHELFEESAAQWPDEPAVKFEHDPAISYAELNKLSNQLARIIRKHGVRPDDLIPLILDDKSVMMVVSIFAILKAGAAYIPIDATQPEKRKAAILQQIMPKLIITNKSSVFSVGKEQNATILMIDDENLLDLMRVEESSNLASSVSTSNLAYLIFTSGSTGTPKGVMVEHGNAACAAAALQTVEQVPRMAKVLQFVNFAFDISVSDIMITLFNGAELVLYRKEHLMNSLASVISSGEISFMRTTTSVLKTINPIDVPMLKTLIVGGEPMTAEVIQTWARKLRLVARYGATEVATACIEMEIADVHHRPSLVGRPLPASGAVILDDRFQPVALGCIGELCITGPQLTRGYFQDQTKTEKAFMNMNGQTIYRTGDSALMNPDGTIDVFGRKDGQVKINGLRIEIGEIETHLLKVQGVAQACVQVFKVKDRSVLTAFVVPNLETAHHLGSQKFFDDLNELLATAQNHLAIGLPSYFVPSRWIPINLIPLTKNGKVDKEKLQELFALSERSTVAENSKQVQFSSETESLLATVWSEVLRLDVNSISPQDSFLKIGGDSIGAILLSANLRKRGYKISVAQIFQTPVLTEMALKLEAESLQVQKYIPFSCPGFSEETMKRTLEPDLIELGTSWSSVEDIYPTSPMQDGLLAITLQIRDQYVAQYIYSLAQDFSVERLQNAWREVIQKTPVLRTTFLYSPEMAEGIQVVVKQPELVWTHIECPVNQEQSTLETYLSDDLELGMTFGKQFVRFATISSSEKSTFVWTIHHALYDGWCLNQILSDVWRAYANEPIVTRVPYAEYIKLIRSLNQEESLAFWGQYLDQCKPTRFPQDAVVPFSNASTSVDKSLDVNLKEFTKKTGITAATLFNVSWAFILAKHENVDDVVFGFTNSGRDVSLAGITDVIGPCINIIPVRVIFDSEQDVWELLSATQTTSQTLATHGHVGLRSITKPLNLGGTPLFQTLINFRQTRFEGIDEELGFIDLLNGQMELQFPLVLDISSGETGATFSIEFRPEVDERLVSWLADQLSTVVTALTANIGTPVLVKDISMIGETMGPILADELSDEHLEVILQENPGSLHASGSIQLLHQFLEHQAAINPSNIAVDCEDEEAITYEELNNRANKLARILSNYGVGPESIVPICLEKSSLMIIGIFGVLKAGAAYVPLDPTNPISRLKLIIHNVEAVVVLTSQKLQSICISCDVETLCIDTVSKVRNGEKIINPTVAGLSSSNLAYIIFTSGSTGEPKGVMIEHFNAVESVWAQARVYNPRSNTRFLQYSNYTFDASIGDIFIPQTVGACICLASKDALMTDVARVIRDMNIDFVYFTATVAAMVEPLECPNLKLIAVGAEPVTRQVLEKWADRVRLLNIYGPTETTVTCIVQEVPSVDFSPKIIGKPFGQNVVHILEGATPVAPGCVGELCISGPQVARGYFKNPSKTAEVFVEVTSGSKMYRTGDLVRLHPGNLIEILGRKDSQIKLHGFRIEVDEIVSAILMDVDVLNSVVLMVESDAPVQPYLCAFFVPSFEVLDTDEFVADVQLLITRVKSNIANILPAYMIPSKWLPISSIPRNASGKTDSRSLIQTLSSLAPELLMRYNTEPSSAFSETDGIPMTANESFVRSTLSSLLKVNESTISKTSSFFNIGGDSVTAILFTAQCRKVGFEIQVAEIMREPRISSIANNLRSHSAAPQPEHEPFALLKSAGLSKEFVLTEFQSQFGVESSVIEDAYPASALQEGMLLLSALNSSFYKLQYVYNLSGVDIEAFKSAWDRMVSRYEIFRTTFALINNQMVSVVYKHTSIDWINISAENGFAIGALNNYLHTDLETPVKFGRSINTFALIELPENTFKFIWLTHHALTDAWYMDSLKSDFLKAYTGQELVHRPPYSHYMKYVLDIDEGESERFWMQYLDNAYPTAFPEDRSIQLSGGNSDVVKAGRMEFPIAVAFKQFLQQHGITPSTVFRAAWAITLALHAGTSDVLFGFINSGREIPVSGISEMIGLCINTIPVRVKVDGSESVENFLRVLQEQNHALVQNSHLGLRKIRRLVADRFEKEMFKTFINFRGFSFDGEAQEYPFSMEQEETPPHLHNYAIGVNADLEGDIVHITADYNKDDVTDEMMVVIMQHFSMIMKSLVANVSGKVSDLVAMPETEQAMLEQGVTASLTETSNEENHIRFLHELVEHAAVMFPNNVAAQFESDESITYFELNNRANKLATSLQQLGVGPETCVPICVDRSIMMLIAILGVLKAGGAYVPLDAANPVARNMRIMETSEAKTILASERHANLFESLGVTVLVLETECLVDSIIYDNPLSKGLTPSSLAYVLFTSGSTGEPKGVMIEHEAAVESIRAQVSVYGALSSSRFLQYSSYTFDVSVGDIFVPLAVGACVCLASKEALMNDLAGVIRDMKIDCTYLTVTVASTVNPAEVPNLKTLAIGAEPVTKHVLQQWAGRVRLLNVYGPTETTIICTVQEVFGVNESPKVLGKPFGKTTAFVLDSDCKVVPYGVIGELCLGGPQLARGYLKDAEKTALGFIEHPFIRDQRLYRTGDLAKLLPGGVIEIAGRRDGQIKLRGLRIEVDEIVSAALSCAGVDKCAVTLINSQNPFLVAFIVPSSLPSSSDDFGLVSLDEMPDIGELADSIKSELASILPPYMIPATWIPITQIPRNSSGKTDSKALRSLFGTISISDRIAYNSVNRATGNEGDADEGEGTLMTANESFVRSTLSSLLKINENIISKTSSFFNIGGDSVTAILFAAECRKVDLEIQVADIMREPRISSIASKLQLRSAVPESEHEPFALLKVAGLSKEFVLNEVQNQFDVQSSSIEDAYPASALQEGMLLLSALKSSFYKIQSVYNLSGVDIEAFKSAWDRMVSRYEIFRTTFALINNRMISVVYKHKSIDWINISAENGFADDALNEYLLDDLETPVKFGRSINTFALIELPENTFKFIWLTHHALTDAWYLDSLKNDFMKAYTGQELMYRPPYSHYMKYVLNLDEVESERFWMQYLDNAHPTAFPEDRTQLSSGVSDNILICHLALFIDNIITQNTDVILAGTIEIAIEVGFKQFLQQHGITPSTVFRAAWAITLALHAGTDDVLFGFINSGREIPVSGISEMIGLCINTVPVRVKVDGSESVENFLRVLQEQNHAVVQNSHLGLRKIRRLVADRFEKEMFKTFINFRGFSFEGQTQEYPFSMEQEGTPQNLHNYAIGVNGDLEGDIVHVTADYNKDDVTDEMMVVIMQHFSMIMKSLVANVSGKVSDLVAMPETEQAMLEQGVTASLTETSNEENHIRFLHELVEHAAVMFPNNVAAQFESDESITYFELNNRANKLATSLQQLGVGPETCVPICVDRSIMMLIAILGVLKAGGAYVPLDAANPVARNMRILETVEAKAILASESLADLFESLGITVLVLEEECLDDGIIYDNPVSMGLAPNSLAYVLFTSGSTGEPKGVMIEHEAAVESIRAQVSVYGALSSSRFLQYSSYTFDVSVGDIFVPLAVGACVCLASKEALMNDLAGVIRDMKIDCTYLTVTVASTVNPAEVPNLKTLAIGAEPVTKHVLQQWAGRVRLLNVYGPTETTIICTVQEVFGVNESPKVLGKPFGKTTAFVLDSDCKVVPYGVIGELCLGGPQLARGYLKDAEKTALGFIEHPFIRDQRLYRTGDLAKLLPGGVIEIAGRRDGQIKLRGLRIEVDEIVSAVLSCVGVDKCAVTLIDGQNPFLVAFIVPSSLPSSSDDFGLVSLDEMPDIGELADSIKSELASILPPYMIPATWIPITQIPRNSSGKTDAKALRSLFGTISISGRIAYNGSDAIKQPPKTKDERVLQTMWSSILNMPSEMIGRDDSFFTIGGDSVTAIVLNQKARSHGYNIKLEQIYRFPVLKNLAKSVSVARKSMIQLVDRFVDIGDVLSNRPTLFILHAVEGLTMPFLTLRGRFTDLNVVALNSTRFYSPIYAKHPTLYSMAREYAESIDSRQPEGTLLIGGYSFGGEVAVQVAQILQEQGRDVGQVILFDSMNHAAVYEANDDEVKRREEVEEFLRWMVSRMPSAETSPGFLDHLRDEIRHNLMLVQSHTSVGHYDGKVALVVAEEEAHDEESDEGVGSISESASTDPDATSDTESVPGKRVYGWEGVLPNLKSYSTPGSHHTIFSKENVEELSAVVQSILQPL